MVKKVRFADEVEKVENEENVDIAPEEKEMELHINLLNIYLCYFKQLYNKPMNTDMFYDLDSDPQQISSDRFPNRKKSC